MRRSLAAPQEKQRNSVHQFEFEELAIACEVQNYSRDAAAAAGRRFRRGLSPRKLPGLPAPEMPVRTLSQHTRGGR
jgi:hypothetical protein